MKRKNQRELKQEQVKEEWERYAESKLMRDIFPNVKEVIVRYKRKSMSFEGAKDIDWRVKKAVPEDRFYFRLSCINRTCVHGGVDLTSMIKTLIEAKQTERTGQEYCQGGEDAERDGQFTCLSEFQYEVAVEYLPE